MFGTQAHWKVKRKEFDAKCPLTTVNGSAYEIDFVAMEDELLCMRVPVVDEQRSTMDHLWLISVHNG